jgi:hypothetical protein
MVTDGISLLIPSSTTIGRTVKGAAASIIARAIMYALTFHNTQTTEHTMIHV